MTVSSPESLTGPVEKIIFHDVESGFCVLLVKAKGRKEAATVVGYVLRVEAGDFIQASGEWLQDRKYGLQFKSEFLTVTAPTTLEGIEKGSVAKFN
jgi:exodeoxyribonuclease V alpha subunit